MIATFIERLIPSLEREIPVMNKIFRIFAPQFDSVNAFISRSQNRAGAILNNINNIAKQNGKSFSEVNQYIHSLLHTDFTLAKRISDDVVKDATELGGFMSDISRIILKQTSDRIDNLDIPELEELIKTRYPFLYDNGMFNEIKNLRKFYNDFYEGYNNLVETAGLDAKHKLGYKPNYTMTQYTFSYDLVGKKGAGEDFIIEKGKFNNSYEVRDYVKNWQRHHKQLIEDGYDFDKYFIKPRLEPSADWQVILKDEAYDRVLKELEFIQVPDIDTLFASLNADPLTELFPRKLNELAYNLNLSYITNSYISKHRIKLAQALFEKFFPSQYASSMKQWAEEMSKIVELDPPKLINEYNRFIGSGYYDKIRNAFRMVLFPPQDKYLQSIFKTILGENVGGVFYNNFMSFATSYPVLKFLFLNFANTLANKIGYYIATIPYVKNINNVLKAENLALQVLNLPEFKNILKDLTTGELLTTNPFIDQLGAIVGKEKFTRELLQLYTLSDPKLQSKIFSGKLNDLVNKSLSLSGFSQVETHNRLGGYILGLLENGVKEEDILNIFKGRLKTTDRALMIESELYRKHLDAIDFTKKVNYIQDPFYNSNLENWIKSVGGDIGKISMVLRHYPLTGIADLVTLFNNNPKQMLKSIMPFLLFSSSLAGITTIPMVGGIVSIYDYLRRNSKSISDLDEKFNKVLEDTLGPDAIKLIRYGSLGYAFNIDLSNKVKFVDNILNDLLKSQRNVSPAEFVSTFVLGVPLTMVTSSMKRAYTSFQDVGDRLTALDFASIFDKTPQLAKELFLPVSILNFIEGYNMLQSPEEQRIRFTPAGKVPIPYKWSKEDIIKFMLGSVPPVGYSEKVSTYLKNMQLKDIIHQQSVNLFRQIDNKIYEHPKIREYIIYLSSPQTNEAVERVYKSNLKQMLIKMYNSTDPQFLPYKEALQKGFLRYKDLHKEKDISKFIDAYFRHIIGRAELVQPEEELKK